MSKIIYSLNGQEVTREEFLKASPPDGADGHAYNFWNIPPFSHPAWGQLLFGTKAERKEADRITRGLKP